MAPTAKKAVAMDDCFMAYRSYRLIVEGAIRMRFNGLMTADGA